MKRELTSIPKGKWEPTKTMDTSRPINHQWRKPMSWGKRRSYLADQQECFRVLKFLQLSLWKLGWLKEGKWKMKKIPMIPFRCFDFRKHAIHPTTCQPPTLVWWSLLGNVTKCPTQSIIPMIMTAMPSVHAHKTPVGVYASNITCHFSLSVCNLNIVPDSSCTCLHNNTIIR